MRLQNPFEVQGFFRAREEFEKQLVFIALQRSNFNQTVAARELQIHRNDLVRRIEIWGWREEVKKTSKALHHKHGKGCPLCGRSTR